LCRYIDDVATTSSIGARVVLVPLRRDASLTCPYSIPALWREGVLK
jgi:hypothetical protein